MKLAKFDTFNKEAGMADWKNRIVGSGVMKVDQIIENPLNWRTHPLQQAAALKGVLEQVGWVQQVIVNKTTGNLVDGHLRVQLAKKEKIEDIPVVFVELSEEEERLVLATYDPITGMATANQDALNDLVASVEADNEGVDSILRKLTKETEEFEDVLLDRSIQLEPDQEYILIICKTADEFEMLRSKLNLGMVRRGGYKKGSEFDSPGVERVIYVDRLLEAFDVNRHTK